MQAQAALAEAIESCKPLLGRYLAGFTEETRTRQAPGLPNHVAWSLGHLALTMHRIAGQLDGREMPERDICPGSDGSSDRFAAETVAFGSRPVDEPALYPSLARCVEIYEAACDRLAAGVRAAGDEQLQQKVKWSLSEFPLHALVVRMVFHNGMHTGQIADLRRALGMKSIFA